MSQISTEYLRVNQVDTDGPPLTVSRSMYEFNPDAYEVLDEPATDAGNNPLAPGFVSADEDTAGYDGWLVAELKAEIDRRNEARDPEGDSYLSNQGVKAELVEVLAADDANPPTPGDAPANPGQ